jgi:hypothetical protein
MHPAERSLLYCTGGNAKAALVEVELDPGIGIDDVDIRSNDGGVVDESTSNSTNNEEGASISRSFDVVLDRLVDQDEVPLDA